MQVPFVVAFFLLVHFYSFLLQAIYVVCVENMTAQTNAAVRVRHGTRRNKKRITFIVSRQFALRHDYIMNKYTYQ